MDILSKRRDELTFACYYINLSNYPQSYEDTSPKLLKGLIGCQGMEGPIDPDSGKILVTDHMEFHIRLKNNTQKTLLDDVYKTIYPVRKLLTASCSAIIFSYLSSLKKIHMYMVY